MNPSQPFPCTLDEIRRWGDKAAFDAALRASENGYVTHAVFDPKTLEATGTVAVNGVAVQTGFRLRKTTHLAVTPLCSCPPARDRGIVCFHLLAVAVTLAKRAESARRPEKRVEEAAHARRIEYNLEHGGSLVRDPFHGIPCSLEVSVPKDVHPRFLAGEVPISVWLVPPPGPDGTLRHIPVQDFIRERTPVRLSDDDDRILFLLEDSLEGNLSGSLSVNRVYFLWLLDQLAKTGRVLYRERALPLSIAKRDQAVPSSLYSSFDHDTRELLLWVNTDVPGMPEGAQPDYFVAGNSGYILWQNTLWPLAKVLPPVYQKVYQDTQVIPRIATRNFIEHELANLRAVFPLETEYDPDLFTWTPAEPKFRLVVTATNGTLPLYPNRLGPATRMQCRLTAVYQDPFSKTTKAVEANAPAADISLPDGDDAYAFRIRNLAAEQAALAVLPTFGITGPDGLRDGSQMRGNELTPLEGRDELLRFLASTAPGLRAQYGWEVACEGTLAAMNDGLDRVAIHVRAVVPPDNPGVFELAYTYRTLPKTADPANHRDARPARDIARRDIVLAKENHQPYVRDAKGHFILFDPAALDALHELETECHATSDPDHPATARISGAQAPFVLGRIQSLRPSEVRFTQESQSWIDRNKNFLKGQGYATDQAVIPAALQTVLRPYQKDGTAWLRFLERNDFGGILADEMGLGKTLQCLAWIAMERYREADRGLPALVVCPTSLVENWAHEAAKFTPWLKVLVVSGSDRAPLFALMEDYDLVVTSYALIRRDIREYEGRRFSIAILDEAQAIKNRGTQNALAVKRIPARTRIAVTGTPIENSLADLWSIMDFLMPTYLGPYEDFHARYETIVALRGDPACMPAQAREIERTYAKLRAKIHPFLLRRRKTTVAKDLPPKIVQTSWTPLSPEQKRAYEDVLRKTREQVSSSVASVGFEKSRMVILTALLRLRQAACHLSLLGDLNPVKNAKEPSGKLDALLDLLDRAREEGHRMLVFSQFVEMLTLIREELDDRGIPYCYLDGSSKDRLESVHRFNVDTTIPVFLISLKAGGTGLNLTGADEVVLFDPWWNPSIEDQAIDRAHRIGQKRTVHALKLIAPGTVEEKVLDMQQRKRILVDSTISDSDPKQLAKMSWDDVKQLFSL